MARNVSIHFQIIYTHSSILFFQGTDDLASSILRPCLQEVAQEAIRFPEDLPHEDFLDRVASIASHRTTKALSGVHFLLRSYALPDDHEPNKIKVKVFYGDIYGEEDLNDDPSKLH